MENVLLLPEHIPSLITTDKRYLTQTVVMVLITEASLISVAQLSHLAFYWEGSSHFPFSPRPHSLLTERNGHCYQSHPIYFGHSAHTSVPISKRRVRGIQPEGCVSLTPSVCCLVYTKKEWRKKEVRMEEPHHEK